MADIDGARVIAFTSEQLAAWYGAVFWPLVRVLALFSVAPVLSHRAIPVRIKVGLALAITVVLMPNLPTLPITDALSGAGLGLLMQNLAVGLVIGFTLRLIFTALELAGEVIGLQMGLSFAAFFNPALGQTQNAVASLMTVLALLMFIAIDGHLMLIHALAESFRVFPLTGGGEVTLTFERVLRLAGDVFGIALTLALPFLAVMLLTNIVLGVLARVAPQLNVFAIGFPLTITVGLGCLFLMLPYIESPLRAALERGLSAWGT